jgi:hypothetical protein
MRISTKISLLILGVFIFLFYRFFLSINPLVAHDWPLLFRESRNSYPFFNMSWDYMGGIGIGATAFKTLWIDLYTNIVYTFSSLVHIPWFLSQRIFWIVPFLLISLFSSYKLSGLFIKKSIYRIISVLIYSFNTYILLIVAGGQFGVAFAYGLSPLVFYKFIQFLKNQNIKNAVLLGLFSGIIIALDPRIAVIIFLAMLFWLVFNLKTCSIQTIKLILLSLIISFSLNIYWLLPLILSKNAITNIDGYSTLQGVKFLSFATFENAFSLLHPNWPENIFGKIYFFKPEFLIIPLLGFSALLFVSKIKNQKSRINILYFVLLVLIGAFLGKGTNEPFGQIYVFFFQNIPGFSVFRDSTKFFILVALCYSILIPYFLENFSKFRNVLVLGFILFWLITLKPAISGELTGIFRPAPIPKEYVYLQKKIVSDKSFYRVLWIPQRQKYGFFEPLHPSLESITLPSESYLADLSIRYVVVPDDTDSEIFLKDRKYNKDIYQKTINGIKQIPFLKEVDGFGKIAVFENPNYREHFWSTSANLKINYTYINSAKYEVKVQNAKKGDLLVFSEGYDKNWRAKNKSMKYEEESIKYKNNLNSFVLPEGGDYSLEVYFTPQKFADIGIVASGFSFVTIVVVLWYLGRRRS